jgi:uncharacterized protein YvpB
MKKLIIAILLIHVTFAGMAVIWNYQPDTKENYDAASIEYISYNENYQEKSTIIPEQIVLDVPIILQRPTLPTGCEIVSTTMMLAYNEVDISAADLAKEIPYDENDPSIGYVGNPFTTGGWTIYPEALITSLYKYLSTVQVLKENDILQIKEQLAKEKPVVVWLTGMHGFTVHSIIISGFDQTGLYYNDPWSGEKNAWISNSEFLKMWENQDYRALSY